MLISKQTCEDSSRFIDRKRKKKGKLFFSTQKEMQQSRKRALTISLSRSESLLKCTCNFQEIQDSEVKDVKEGSLEKLQWIQEETL